MSEEFSEDIQEESTAPKRKGLIGTIVGFIPMLLVSITMHLAFLFVIALVPGSSPPSIEETTVITVFEEEEEAEEEPEEIEKIELEVTEVEVEVVEATVDPVQEEVLDMEDIIDEPMDDSLDELMDLTLDMNDQSMEDIGNLAVMGIGGASSSMPGGYSNRSGAGKRKAMGRYGADGKTEEAVERALKWLAEHQEPDGSWIADKFEAHLGDSKKETSKVATTAMALLPFLGAGHNEMAGKYKRTVRTGFDFINKVMSDPKVFKRPHFHNNYGTAIALTALAETTIFGSSPTSKKNANRIAEYFIDQYMQKPGEGWHYGSAGDDFSVSGWIAIGLKSGKAAELKALETKEAKTVLKDYKKWTDKVMTDKSTGLGFYRTPGSANKEGKARKGTISMSWVGMFQKQALGFSRSDPFLKKASEVLIDQVKKGNPFPNEGLKDAYRIYYGTLSAFQQQGKPWDTWNPVMKKSLVSTQRQGAPKDMGGSWDPTPGHFGEKGGRIFTTAVLALCLEVYYRYDMMN